MEYTIIVNGRSYDLPKKTLTVVESLDEVMKVDEVKGLTVKQKFEKLHSFMKGLVGEDNAEEMFGSKDLADIDLSELTLAVRYVIDAYDKPVTDYEVSTSTRKLDGLPIDKIIATVNAAEKVVKMPAKK
jgi:hypothetical protein